MLKRRSLAYLSQEEDEKYGNRRAELDSIKPPHPFRLRQSASCPDNRPNSSFYARPVRVTMMNSQLLRKVESRDEEIQLLMENQEQTLQDIPTNYFVSSEYLHILECLFSSNEEIRDVARYVSVKFVRDGFICCHIDGWQNYNHSLDLRLHTIQHNIT
ncbi:hypothetical protein NECAME_17605 [Necator americanus]|uniref:Uncharacterized protein n=1 Tax=Necator americanus TaxID=51031 RepID=W2TP64_NECAM|nr:hypothetical protein NECAME_17605 [Necator americanus]ETN82926.1 hypothetical protein NECAME_17605 [Necator americanus]